MPEGGHESVEEDRRGSVSQGFFRVHLRPLRLESSRRPLIFLQSRSELADKTNCQHDGSESTKSRSLAARKHAPRVISNAKKRSRCLLIVRLVRPIVSYLWLRNSVTTFVAVDYFIGARSQGVRQSLTDFAFTTDESPEGSLCVEARPPMPEPRIW